MKPKNKLPGHYDNFVYPKNFDEVKAAAQIQFFDPERKGSVIQDYKSFKFETIDRTEIGFQERVEQLIFAKRLKISK